MQIEFSPTAINDLAIIKRSHSIVTKNRLTRILQPIIETFFQDLLILKL
jgi:hypothetical protein